MLYLWIAIAGGGGAVLRFSVARFFSYLGMVGFPYATLLVNFLGSFAIGYLALALQEKWQVSYDVRMAILTGFLGGFTTYSAFSLETLLMLQQGNVVKAVVYLLFTVIFCLGACALGIVLAR